MKSFEEMTINELYELRDRLEHSLNALEQYIEDYVNDALRDASFECLRDKD